MEQFWNLSNEYGFSHDPVLANSDCDMIEGFQDYNAVLEYLNSVLMEDEGKDMSCLIDDSTLHAAEKSLYHILTETQRPPPSEQIHHQEPFCSDATISNSLGYWGMRENDKKVLEGKAKAERGEDELTYSLQQGRRIIQDDSHSEEGDCSKQLAFCTEEIVLSEMLDTLLRFDVENKKPTSNSNDGVWRKKRIGKRDHVYLKSLLFQCMQSVAINDHYTADKLLKQIKQTSSPSGNASQRLAHCFVEGLEARLAGTGNLIYRSLTAKVLSTSDALKAYTLFGSAIPLTNAAYYYKNQTILELAKKATSLHIIQFGSRYGNEFVPIIQHLSNRSGGPPKLRITGINFPEPGFVPAAMVEKAGRRLGNYCNRFNVPFEYHGISQKWETVNLEDLKIQKDEVLVVVCSYVLHYLLDDSILENNPRDAVLKLINRINPDVFIHGVWNAQHNSPFFISRFREAFFYFSAVFDMLEATMPKESPWRMILETEMWGKEILNTIACEGLERIERPETYRKWQQRTFRAGFRQLPLNQQIIKKIKAKVEANHHKDFFVDEADQWMVKGWKGRVLFALSCWKPY